jgi:sugar lactone lactonase YvrE
MATATISPSSFYPGDIAFDSAGNLWAGDSQTGDVIKYLAADIQGSGTLSVSPALTVTGLLPANDYLRALAFDAAGNLWVLFASANPPGGSVLKLSAGQLVQSGAPSPTLVLDTSDLSSPMSMAFDAAGNLWVANTNLGPAPSIVRFDASLLSGTGHVSTDSLVLTSSAIESPDGLAFDESGGLWVTNAGVTANNILNFTASQIQGSGTMSITPAIIIGTQAGSIFRPAFDPAPAALPLQH